MVSMLVDGVVPAFPEPICALDRHGVPILENGKAVWLRTPRSWHDFIYCRYQRAKGWSLGAGERITLSEKPFT
jgi:hypothetical protein